jgi:hypothetical protein
VKIFEVDSHRVPNPLNNGKVDPGVWEKFDMIDDIEHDLIDELKQLSPNENRRSRLIRSRDLVTNLGKHTVLPIAKLILTEPTYDPEHVKKITRAHNKLPDVYKFNNEYIVRDGNHRVLAQHFVGETTIAVNLIDTNDITQLADKYFDARQNREKQ